MLGSPDPMGYTNCDGVNDCSDSIDPNWLHCNSGAAGAILQTVLQEQRYAELPYLADALMDAGCGEEALLRHLREPGGHVRGCWAIDALLGKK